MNATDTAEARIRTEIGRLDRRIAELNAHVVRAHSTVGDSLVNLAKAIAALQDQVSLLATHVGLGPEARR